MTKNAWQGIVKYGQGLLARKVRTKPVSELQPESDPNIMPLEKWKSTYPLYWKRSPISKSIVTSKIFARINDLDIQNALNAIEINCGLDERRRIEDKASNKRLYMIDILTRGNHYLPEMFNSKTLMSAANPPVSVPSMTRVEIFAGDLYAPDVLAETLLEAGFDISNQKRILDFGCSSARVLRNLYAAYPEVSWYGCDPQSKAIEWAEENFPQLKLLCSKEEPPLEYGDSQFDGCFAFSIWSHFSEKMAVAWLDEMHRITKKGGFLFLTTCGFNTIATLIERHPQRWPAHRVDDVFGKLISDGFVFEEEYKDLKNFALDTSKYGMAYFIVDWILSLMIGKWSLRSFHPARSGHQDVYVLEKV